MIDTLNLLGKQKKPFIFIIDFEAKRPIVIPLEEARSEEIFFDINGYSNFKSSAPSFDKNIILEKKLIDFYLYKEAFDKVRKEFINGNSFLLNLTFPTEIKINLTLEEIFKYGKAKYKLFFKDQFTVFSPETFVIIKNDIISSYPMKGTINAEIPNAREKILSDEKEFAEHITIVDLLRNDLGIISQNVKVEKFRYLDLVKTNEKNLYQTSSKICGELSKDWESHIGDILYSLLPAGSVTGAPKKKTVEIIKNVENYERGYYTGVFGYYLNGYLESGVMIRFVEKKGEKLFFKSGGGLTIYSEVEKEYNELSEKIYVPIA
ncbi:MAG TPA: aminodeoxychorismate synthase component I [Spirochaetota bacterium]|nr:aminodeoxychorismate synthase component I [Spirochaetota bacterium]